MFLKRNGYPLWTIKQLMKEIEEKQKQKEVTQISMTEQPNPQEQKVSRKFTHYYYLLRALKVQLLLRI